MIQNRLFNSPFEMGLRILLLLMSSHVESYTVDKMIGLDFITCYAADFGLPYPNLHGENNYKYGEVVGRRIQAQEAVKDLVTSGLLDVAVNRGYQFSVSERGRQYADSLGCAYATEYKQIAETVTLEHEHDTDEELFALIHSRSVRSLRG